MRHLAAGRGDRRDVVLVEQLRDRAARAVAKDRQRVGFGSDDRDRQVDGHLACSTGSHQRQLVDRQRPRILPGDHERDLVHIAALDVLDQSVQGVVEAGIVDRDRVRVTHVGLSAHRQHERVVAQPCAPSMWTRR